MKKYLIWIFKLCLIIPIIIILYLNCSLYYKPTIVNTNLGQYNKSVYNQLQFLKQELKKGAGDQMQNYFPEGFMFINSLYGLSWCNLIKQVDSSSPIHQEGIQQIDWAITQVQSEKAKNIFDYSLPLNYGAFYTGWTNYLLGSKLSIQKPKDRNPDHVQNFKNTCLRISNALNNSKTPYLESYSGLSWPADITSAVASLSLHDKIYEPKYKITIQSWIASVKENLDSSTGLIPHQYFGKHDQNMGMARGCSQSLILNFLYEIDEKFAKKQFDIFKKLFLDYRFGLPGIREYPKGSNGSGDIDSGPVIFNIGGAASIVGQRTMFKFGEVDTYKGLRNSIEAFGAAYTTKSKKKYVFGQLPIADAFICWSNSIEEEILQSTSYWRITFQAMSIILLFILVFLFKRLR